MKYFKLRMIFNRTITEYYINTKNNELFFEYHEVIIVVKIHHHK